MHTSQFFRTKCPWYMDQSKIFLVVVESNRTVNLTYYSDTRQYGFLTIFHSWIHVASQLPVRVQDNLGLNLYPYEMLQIEWYFSCTEAFAFEEPSERNEKEKIKKISYKSQIFELLWSEQIHERLYSHHDAKRLRIRYLPSCQPLPFVDFRPTTSTPRQEEKERKRECNTILRQ